MLIRRLIAHIYSLALGALPSYIRRAEAREGSVVAVDSAYMEK
jgi:hypothetical protein